MDQLVIRVTGSYPSKPSAWFQFLVPLPLLPWFFCFLSGVQSCFLSVIAHSIQLLFRKVAGLTLGLGQCTKSPAVV